MQDLSIVELYWARDEAAIWESQCKYGTYCHSIAQNILFNCEDSEECVNDTWMRAWNTIPPQRPSVLHTFFGKITRRLAFDRYKLQTAQKRGGGEIALVLDELDGCIPSADRVEDNLEAKELAQSIMRFLKALPERECNLFIRRYFFAETVQVIAKRYGLTANHVAVVLSRVRTRLKDHLRKEGYGV